MEVLDGPQPVLFDELPQQIAPEQVFFVGSRIDRWHRRQTGTLVRPDLHAKLVSDRSRDIALQLEEIRRVSFEVTGPQMRVSGRMNQLNRDFHAPVLVPDRTFDRRIDLQLATDGRE